MTDKSAQATELVDDPVIEANPPRWLQPARAWMRRRPGGAALWKAVIALVGVAIVLLGVLLIPLPGPGWAIVFLGVAVWATEFVWAKRLLLFGQGVLRRWTGWAMRQSHFVRGLLGLGGLLVAAGVIYLGWRFIW